jgi:hypothetical protein
MISRRKFISTGASLSLGALMPYRKLDQNELVTHQITSGTKQHWFGYYDKLQIDHSGRFALGGQVDTFFRSPTLKDRLEIGIIDMQKENKWSKIGTSNTWGWQQGCMLQWIPGASEEVIWNDVEKGKYVSRIYHLAKKEIRTLPRPIYTLDPKGRFALCIDFDRLQFFRPGYGYPRIDPGDDFARAPDNRGIYKMDLKTGVSELIITYADIAKLEFPGDSLLNNFHWFNHILINPSGSRFIFLNRSRIKGSMSEMEAYLKEHPEKKREGFSNNYVTRAITSNLDGTEIYPLNDSGQFSHFIWKGDDVITAWSCTEDSDVAAFFEFPDRTKKYLQLGVNEMTVNGHNTYVPGTNYEWILNDTYPSPDDRKQTLYLFHVPTGRKIILGRFYEPDQFKGEWRCDLHPRCDQQGQRVFFDSSHEGDKRQMYMIDIRDIMKT